MRTDLAGQIHDLMERGLRPVSMADLESRPPVRVSALRRATAARSGPGYRRGTVVAAGVTAVACAGAIVAAQLSGGPSGPGGSRTVQARTAAYVINRVSKALAIPNLVMQATETYRTQYPGVQWPVNVDWAYRGRSRTVQYAPAGIIEQGTTMIGANLAKLTITIPRGYRQVHFSAPSLSRGGIQYYVDG
jgi:hypothetical protein